MSTLQSLDISVSSYSAFIIVRSVVAALVWITIGCLIFWRKSDDWETSCSFYPKYLGCMNWL